MIERENNLHNTNDKLYKITKRMSLNIKNEDDRKSYEKVGRIYNALRECSIDIIYNLLQTEGDINYRISEGSNVVSNFLHATTYSKYILLLQCGADFTSNGNHGGTVVHTLIQEAIDEGKLLLERKFGDWRIDKILDAHVEFNNPSNPRDENGLSHFHAACMTDNKTAVEFYLKNGVDVNQAVNADSPHFSSDTPLHLAVKFTCPGAVDVLLKYRANIHSRNSAGLSPLHLIVKRKTAKYEVTSEFQFKRLLSIFLKFVIDSNSDDVNDFSKLHLASLLQDQSTVQKLLETVSNINQVVNLHSPVCAGFTALHFAAFSNIEVFKFLLGKKANIETRNAIGNTSFDYCLPYFNAKDIHSILLSKIEWKNVILSDKRTRLIDVVSAMSNEKDFISFLIRSKSVLTACVPFDSPLWPGCTLLHLVVVFARKIFDEKSCFSQQQDDTKLVAECLRRGADMTVADAKGSTALHVAFYMGKYDIVEYLLDRHDKSVNPFTKDNLSHFHIACAAGHLKAVDQFLSIGVNVNARVRSTFEFYSNEKYRHFYICPGSTALHINVAHGNEKITKKLLKNGADVHAQDVNGFTPIHRLLSARIRCPSERQFDILLSVKNLKNSVTNCGLSHLHVACYFDHSDAVKRLLKLGADINAPLTYKSDVCVEDYDNWFSDPYGEPHEPLSFLSVYAGYTPLHFSWNNGAYETALLLIKQNADVLAKNCKRISPMQMMMKTASCPKCPYFPCKEFTDNKVIQTYLEKKFGITKLHMACLLADVKLVRSLIKGGANVNAKVHSSSPIWREHTPLHCTIRKVIDECLFIPMECKEGENALTYKMKKAINERSRMNLVCRLDKIVRLLIENGADLSLMDDNCDTPFHLLKNFYYRDKRFLDAAPFVPFLLENWVDFNANSMNYQKLSLFHIACMTGNVPVIKKYLEHGVDVNQPTSYFLDDCPGSTPLHLVLKYSDYLKYFSFTRGSNLEVLTKIVDLLLQHGANINAIDAFGNTPLHDVSKLKSSRGLFIQKFISNGADIHSVNVRGHIPLWTLLSGDFVQEDIEAFLKYGCDIRTCPRTQQKYIGTQFVDKSTENQEIGVNSMGRTVLHNIVTLKHTIFEDHLKLIGKITTGGCDVDYKDNEGKTALHLAASLDNTRAISELLKSGADINIIDKCGKTAFAYCFKVTLPDEGWWYELWQHRREDRGPTEASKLFARHVCKLEFCGQCVSQQNEELRDQVLENWTEFDNNEFDCFRGEIEKTKSMSIGSTSLSLYTFLMDNDTDIIYMNMTYEDRQEIDVFFEQVDDQIKFSEISGLLRLKYRQSIERTKIVGPALESLSFLIKFQLPDLCGRYILKFLHTQDLKQLIASVA